MFHSEHYRLAREGLSKSLERKIAIPRKERRRHILSAYVSEELLPPDIDIYVCEDFKTFGRHLYPDQRFDAAGVYFHLDACWVKEEDNLAFQRQVEKDYGIQTSRAIFLAVEDGLDLRVLRHECFHDFFQLLSEERKKILLDAACICYEDDAVLSQIVWISNTSIRENWEVSTKGRLIKEYYHFSFLKPSAQLPLLDEFLAHYLTEYPTIGAKVLPKEMREALQDVGYKLENYTIIP